MCDMMQSKCFCNLKSGDKNGGGEASTRHSQSAWRLLAWEVVGQAQQPSLNSF